MTRQTRCTNGARHGFTLLEVSVGLVLVGLLLGGVWTLLQGTTDGHDRITKEAIAADERRNGERQLESMFANADVSTDSANRFMGDEQSAAFNTWCAVPQGWLERCRVKVQLSNGVSGGDVLWVAGANTRMLRHFADPIRFRYFGDVGGEAQWSDQWGRSTLLPDAIALVTDGDTTVIGGRGHQ